MKIQFCLNSVKVGRFRLSERAAADNTRRALAALAFELDGGPVHQRFAPRSGLQGRHELLTYFEIRKENKSNFKASSYEVGKVSLGIKSFVEKLRGHFGRAK